MLVFSTGIFCNSFSQTEIFTPATENREELQRLSTMFEKKYEKEIAALPSQNKKDFEKVYNSRWKEIKEKFDSAEIYTSPKAQQYLDAIVGEITKANPLLQNKDFHCYFSRSPVPNASNMAEGIILFNIGLFSKLENESQVAFVLCHELSHFYLNHSENSIAAYVYMINSDEVQKELRKIKKEEYGKREVFENLVKGLTFDSRRHGRDHESQADSMALEFMHNSRFDINQSLTALSLLDLIDADTLGMNSALQKMFNAKEYPFQKKWLAKQEGLLGGHAVLHEEEALADSLKTHPDCKIRIKYLEPVVAKYNSTIKAKNIIDSATFTALKNIFRYEIIDYTFEANNYSKSLYYTINLLQTKPADPYLIAQTGKIFNSFYYAQKNHKLSKVVDLPSPHFEPDYNLLLQFIQNLYLENYALINYNFLKQYEQQLSYYSLFTENYKRSRQLTQQ